MELRERLEQEKVRQERRRRGAHPDDAGADAAAVEGLELSAVMKPAAEVGGDYYDVLATDEGGWLGIGDVAGHGLAAGLVMLMIQSMISALDAQRPGRQPRGHPLCGEWGGLRERAQSAEAGRARDAAPLAVRAERGG